MSGNSKDGYRLGIDNLFSARVSCKKSPGYHTYCEVTVGGLTVFGKWLNGIHEQQAANAVAKWFEKRANGWGYR
jgi:hypothetical protein